MYIIDETYFNKDLIIPNSTERDISGGLNVTELWIDEQVRVFLQDAFGNDLFDDLDSNIKDGVLSPTAPQKWLNVVNGTKYTFESKSYTWRGLIYTQGTSKESLLAKFVYSQWIDPKRTRLSGIGEVIGKSIDSEVANTNRKYIRVYNEFLDQYQSDECKSYVSLLTYLDHFKSDFENADKTEYEYENLLGF